MRKRTIDKQKNFIIDIDLKTLDRGFSLVEFFSCVSVSRLNLL